MFIDRVKIFIKAGCGGNGCTSFYTEKYVNNGGPDGGDGGKGGDVLFEADARMSSLLDFKYASHFRAEDGEKGSGRYCHGKAGKPLIVRVPCGTVIKDEESGGIIADLTEDGARVTVLTGGRGGKGNARYKSSRRQAPAFSQLGEPTVERCVILELKTIADVGLVGYPNVGKSTLLSSISAAKPKIANYPFTTLSPNLGVVRVRDHSFVAADIPGLIDGASDGAGLGIDFLRHIERTRLIVHLVDISGSEGRDPYEDYKNINRELKAFSVKLAALPQIVALNKAELLENDVKVKEFARKVKVPCVPISAATRQGLTQLLDTVWETLSALPPAEPLDFEPFVYPARNTEGFSISRDDDGAFEVTGGMIEELARNVVLSSYDSFAYFQKKLRDEGVIKALKKAGAAEGDTVRIMDVEFEFVE
ncbi:MAG: GTPase ObgE [Clostridiales bacterium]|nr:GTPase ObgE [Clostridiales bacterium]